MDITPQLAASSQRIDAYGDGGFRIANIPYSGSVIVFPEHTMAWDMINAENITLEALRPALTHDTSLEILLIGCGKTHIFLPHALRRTLKEHGVSMDSMDTGAACRTFNILLAEGRRVAAALIAV